MAKTKTAKKRPTKKKRPAAKKSVNKSQAIRDYLKSHRSAGPTEVQEALAKKGIKVTAALVSNVKANAKKPNVKKKKKTTARSSTNGRASQKPATQTPMQDVRQAGDLLMQAVELVTRAGAKEAQQLVSTASDLVKKVRSSD